MHTQVGHVLGHVPRYELSGRIEQVALSRQLKTEQCLAVQKALGPIRPSAGCVFAGNGKNRRSVIRVPAPEERSDLARGYFRDRLCGP
jgi:hypothetical protein